MLLLSTIYLLISNALTIRREITITLSRSVMYLCFFLCWLVYINYIMKLLDKGLPLYSGLFFIKPYIFVFTIFIFFMSSLILALTSYYPRKKWNENLSLFKMNELEYSDNSITNKNLEQYKILEYSLLILFILNGATLLMSSNDLISIFLCIELQSYGLYLLCAVYRDSELSSKAALTYFLLGGLSSCIILLGQSLIYINTGNTNLDGLYIISNISQTINNTLNIDNNFMNIYIYYIQTSLVIFSVGFLFKISSAPFHNWSPDVYDQIPTIVTTFVAIIAKISILIMFFELVYYTTSNGSFISWKNNLLLSALLSLVIGSVLGLTQSRIKRLYAYSTISHLGFILLSLSVISVESAMAFFFYIIQYSITNLCAFLILINIGYTLYIYSESEKETETRVEKNITDTLPTEQISRKEVNGISPEEENRNYSPIQYNIELSNYYKINTFLALSLGLTLFSFLGVPPLIGFFGKQVILSAALDRGYVFMVLVAILTSVISAVYYLVVIKIIFFDNNNKYNKISDKQNESSFISTDNINILPKYLSFNDKEIKLNSYLSNIISLLNIIIIQYMFTGKFFLSSVLLLSLLQLQ